MSGRRLYALSGALFAPAWFLTTVHTSGDLIGGRSAGWQAFLFAISPLFGSDAGDGVAMRIWMVVSALTNVLLVTTFAFVVWRPQAIDRRLVGALAACVAINAYWFLIPDMRGDLRVGYYVWLAAFAIGTVAAGATVREQS